MWVKLAVFIFLAWFARKYIDHMIHMGYHKNVYNQKPGPCTRVQGVENGSEDIEVLSNGLAIISSGLSIPFLGTQRGQKGEILLLDLNHLESSPSALKIEGDVDQFNPHGISVWQDKLNHTVYVFVINHLTDQDSVEIFKLNQKTRTLELYRSIRGDPAFAYTNDLVATGPDTFYFTNCLYFRSQLEVLLQLGWSSIGYFDGEKGTLVATGYHLLNGINISPDGNFLYVASTVDHGFMVFKRQTDNKLQYIKSHTLYTSVDNIDVDPETGHLWLGCAPLMYQVMEYFKDKTVQSASQVLRVKMRECDVAEVNQVYMDDGREFAGSSVAVRYHDTLLVGSVQSHLLLCQLNYIPD